MFKNIINKIFNSQNGKRVGSRNQKKNIAQSIKKLHINFYKIVTNNEYHELEQNNFPKPIS